MYGIEMSRAVTTGVACQSPESQIARRCCWRNIPRHLLLFIPDDLKIEAAPDPSDKIPAQRADVVKPATAKACIGHDVEVNTLNLVLNTCGA